MVFVVFALIEIGWKAKISPAEHPVSQYEFDVLIGADGKRNTLEGTDTSFVLLGSAASLHQFTFLSEVRLNPLNLHLYKDDATFVYCPVQFE